MPPIRYDRRAFMAYFSSIGLGTTLLPGVLWARASAGEEITPQVIAAAEEIAGVSFTEDQREMMVEGLERQEKQIAALHATPLSNDVAPALLFDPVPPGVTLPGAIGTGARAPRKVARPARAAKPSPRPQSDDELAFLPATGLASLLRARKVSSVELTQLYLARLKKYDPVLHCVISLTEERALAQARARDAELARGRDRGALHGIPWGAKDLLAVKGYPTTWGAAPYREQVIDEDATVVQRLDEAGAVLVAKLTLGALAMGDVWFGGMTRNPWKVDQGSSGSSAGPGSATAAGLVGFAVGSETLGSISSPSTRNGVTGLRPTFGRVPRTGAMALSWSMDKLGPMARSVEDCALVLEAIYGPDGRDLTVRDVGYRWDPALSPKTLRVGYVKSAFELPEKNAEGRVQHPTKAFDDAALAVLRDQLGLALVPVEIPEAPYDAMRLILDAEAAAAFDELTRSGRDRELTAQGKNDWPNTFRMSRFIPAVDYVNANRARTLAMQRWAKLFETVDVIVAPTFSQQLVATNLTGHPAVILPSGFREDGTPVSLTFLGNLYREDQLLAVARAWQAATPWHLRHPTVPV